MASEISIDVLLRLVESSLNTADFPVELYRAVADLLDREEGPLLEGALQKSSSPEAAKRLKHLIQNCAYSPVDLFPNKEGAPRVMLFGLLVNVTLPTDLQQTYPNLLNHLRLDWLAPFISDSLPVQRGDAIFLANGLVPPEAIALAQPAAVRRFARSAPELFKSRLRLPPFPQDAETESFTLESNGCTFIPRVIVGSIVGKEGERSLEERFCSERNEQITETILQSIADALERKILLTLPALPGVDIEVCPSIQPLQVMPLQASAMRAVASTVFEITPFLDNLSPQERKALSYRIAPTGFADRKSVRLEIASSDTPDQVLFMHNLSVRPELDSQEGILDAMSEVLRSEGVSPCSTQEKPAGGEVVPILRKA